MSYDVMSWFHQVRSNVVHVREKGTADAVVRIHAVGASLCNQRRNRFVMSIEGRSEDMVILLVLEAYFLTIFDFWN